MIYKQLQKRSNFDLFFYLSICSALSNRTNLLIFWSMRQTLPEILGLCIIPGSAFLLPVPCWQRCPAPCCILLLSQMMLGILRWQGQQTSWPICTFRVQSSSYHFFVQNLTIETKVMVTLFILSQKKVKSISSYVDISSLTSEMPWK